jgi:hypothetical protein
MALSSRQSNETRIGDAFSIAHGSETLVVDVFLGHDGGSEGGERGDSAGEKECWASGGAGSWLFLNFGGLFKYLSVRECYVSQWPRRAENYRYGRRKRGN